MKREELLDKAKEYTTKDRASTYSSPEESFRLIADLWTSYRGVAITPKDVAAMMVLLKVARIAKNPDHEDSWVDIAGYAACGVECGSVKEDTLEQCIEDVKGMALPKEEVLVKPPSAGSCLMRYKARKESNE
jgi:hypothetical protein